MSPSIPPPLPPVPPDGLNPIPEPIIQRLVDARKALQRGDRESARLFAQQVADQVPTLEEPWLILASLAGPRQSIQYIEKALAINPESRMAREGMHWAIERVRRSQGDQPVSSKEGGIQSASQGDLRSQLGLTPEKAELASDTTHPNSAASSTSRKNKSEEPARITGRTNRRRTVWWPWVSLLVVACLAATVWAVWPGNALPASAYLFDNLSQPQATSGYPAAPLAVIKPTYTPTFTPSPSPTPTATNTPLPTTTPLPTQTSLPTWTPAPTQVVVQPGLGGERWVDVNLSQQMVYAYEGNTVVASFLVSTGTWMYPTVVGQYNIYVKYLYADMTGPGYYLPNVPYVMYFYEGYSLHGTYWHHNFGTPMSHGCVNMSIPDAAWMYDFTSIGTLVNIHY